MRDERSCLYNAVQSGLDDVFSTLKIVYFKHMTVLIYSECVVTDLE